MTPAFVFPSFVPAPGFPSLNRIPSVPSSPLFPPPALPAFPEGGLVRCDRLSRWGLSLPLAAVRCAFFCVFPLTAPLSLRGLPFLSLPCPLGRVAWVPPSLACRIPSNVLPRTPPRPQEKRACPRREKKRLSILEIEFHFHYGLSTWTRPPASSPDSSPGRDAEAGRRPSPAMRPRQRQFLIVPCSHCLFFTEWASLAKKTFTFKGV